MIRIYRIGRPIGGKKKFHRDILESLPEELPKCRMAVLIGASLDTLAKWSLMGLPFKEGQSKRPGVRAYAAHMIKRDQLIDWLRRTNRVYHEEWPDQLPSPEGDGLEPR